VTKLGIQVDKGRRGGGHGKGSDWLTIWFTTESFSLFLLGWANTGGLGTGEGLSVHLSVEVLKPRSLLKLSPQTRGPKNYSRPQSHTFTSWGWGRERSVTNRPGPTLPNFDRSGRACGVGEGEVYYKQTRPGTVSEGHRYPQTSAWGVEGIDGVHYASGSH